MKWIEKLDKRFEGNTIWQFVKFNLKAFARTVAMYAAGSYS